MIGEVQISGGEPFEHPDLVEMVEYCKSRELSVTVYTSGVVHDIPHADYKDMTEEQRMRAMLFGLRGQHAHLDPQVLERLKEVGLDKIVFDLPAEDEQQYEQLMGTDNGISKVLRSMIYASGTGWANIDTEIHFVPTKINYQGFEDVVFLAEQHQWKNIKQISVLRFVPQGRGEKNRKELLLSDEELAWFIQDVQRIKSEYKVPIRLGIPLSPDKQHECTAGNDKFLVGANGLIYPCPAFKCIDSKILEDQGIAIGHINSIDELQINERRHKTPLCDAIHSMSL